MNDGPKQASPARRLAALTLVVAVLFAACAWTTELRVALHGGLIALCIFAFLPFAIIATVFGAMFLFGLILGFATEGGAHGSDLAGFAETLRYAPRGIRAYYGFLARHRASIWIAAPAGLLLGTLIVWALLAALVVPHELRTTELLLRLRSEVEQSYQSTKDYPRPLDAQHYRGAHNVPVLDDFGKPLIYEVHGTWRAKSYRIRSYGADGQASGDDLCVQGQTKLQRAIDTSAALVSLGQTLLYFKTGVPVRDRLSVLQAVQCEHGYLDTNPQNQL